MGLKKASFNFTDRNGYDKTIVIVVSAVVFDYENQSVEVIFKGWKDQAARDAGLEPQMIAQRLAIAPDDRAAHDMVSAVSDAIWARAVDAPVIEDFSTVVNGRVVGVRRTLNELGAVIEEVNFKG